MEQDPFGRGGLEDPLLEDDIEPDKARIETSTQRATERKVHTQEEISEMVRNVVVAPITAEKKRGIDEFTNNTHRSIDFSAELKALKRRTELDMPYTVTQCEDAMYIDQSTVVTLEFHYFQNDCKYTNLRPLNEHIDSRGKLVDENGNDADHLLGTQDYQAGDHGLNENESQFLRKDLVNLVNVNDDIILRHKATKNTDFFRVYGDLDEEQAPKEQQFKQPRKPQKRKDDFKLLQGVLALYKVSKTGGMQRVHDVELKMGRRFFPSSGGNMTLTRSRDKTRIALVNFERHNVFGDFFKVMAWTIKLTKVEVRQELNEGMNLYYNGVKNSFDELVEVAFVGRCDYVMMIYVEKTRRGLQEQQDFEKEIDKNDDESSKKKDYGLNFQKRNTPRRAQKYVFFDATTGEVVFEYGGVHKCLDVANQNGDVVQLYELGLLIKEIREEKWAPKFYFFTAGDFWSEEFKQKQFIFRWALNVVVIDMDELFSQGSQEEISIFLNKRLMDSIPQNQLNQSFSISQASNGSFISNISDLTNQREAEALSSIRGNSTQKRKEKELLEDVTHYLFDDKWITCQKFNWEINISVSANRLFDQFAFISAPPDTLWLASSNTYYITGPKFFRNTQERHEVPYYIKLRNDCKIYHGRNAFLKQELFYDQHQSGEVRTVCLRIDHKEEAHKVKPMNILISNHLSTHDSWLLNAKKKSRNNLVIDIFQAISVQKGDQYALLQTRIPKQFEGNVPKDYHTVVRKANQFLQQIGDFPFIAYNLSESKIIIQNVQQVGTKCAYILHMTPGDKFIGFVEFIDLMDIGFFPEDLRIECCSRFAYLTRREGKHSTSENHLNLLLVDAFCPSLQAALFKSSTTFDNVVFNEGDFVMKSVIQSNRGRNSFGNSKTYIWSQFADKIIRSKMFKPNAKQVEDSDNAMEEDEIVAKDDKMDEFDQLTNSVFVKLSLIQDDRGFIYYVTLSKGQVKVIEGNPRDPYIQHHQCIFTLKSKKCLGFSLENEYFYLVSDKYIIYKLTRNKNDRKLIISSESTMKDTEMLYYTPGDFESSILDEKYSVLQSKIYYFFENGSEPFPDRIFEAEELIEEEKTKTLKEHLRGPFVLTGSNMFYCVFRQSKQKSFLRMFQRPNKVQKSLVNDFQNYVDMSTFLENGNILLKCRRRYMVFTGDGNFVDEVYFNNDRLEEEESQNDEISELSEGDVIPLKPEDLKNDILANKKKQRQIMDFCGNFHLEAPERPEPPLSVLNKMELLQFSFNNRYFLFFDRIIEKLLVYELCKLIEPEDSSFFNFQEFTSEGYEFVLKYELKMESSYISKYLTLNNIDCVQYFRSNPGQIKVDDKSSVKICYCQNIGTNEAYSDHGGIEESEQQQQCKIIVCIFKQDGDHSASKNFGFSENFQFPFVAQYNMSKIVEWRIGQLEKKINNVRVLQSRRPEVLHDYSEYENLWKDRLQVENQDTSLIFAKFYYDHLIVIYCGNYLKFGKVVKNEDQITLEITNGQAFQDVNLTLSNDTEIIKLVETSNKDCLQILAKNHQKNIIFIVTWDFVQNIEKNMYQVLPLDTAIIGTHIVKGMNYKMNYYIDDDYVIDLDCNIPLKQVNVFQGIDPCCTSYAQQLRQLDQLYNQRKLFEDNRKFLGIEKANCLYFDLSRMDVLLWRDINAVGESAELISSCCTIDSLNLSFGGVSLFHYFAPDANIIEAIRNKMLQEAQGAGLSRTQRTLPLQIVNPDNDQKTALYRAVANQSQRSFELMIFMLNDNSNLCVTKTMLKSLTLVLLNEQESVVNFFDGAFYQPPQMIIDWFVPWDDGREELVFPCHTSVISQKLLMTKLEENGVDMTHKKKTFKKGKDNQMNEEEDLRNQIIMKKKQMNKFQLLRQYETGLDAGEQPLKRVTVEALDFDWIFECENAKTLLAILANDASDLALTRRSIRIFIQLMWSKYQSKIIYYIFYPYCLYLFIICFLSGHLVGRFLDSLSAQDDLASSEKDMLSLQASILTPVCFILLLLFGSLELKQVFQSGLEYFLDPWNCIDIISLYCNFVFLLMLSCCVWMEEEYFNINLMHTIGSFSCFFMWIKIFYWMRLFQSLAYYVKLIQQTITDIAGFMLMVVIILTSFGSYLYVSNLNLAGTAFGPYYPKFFDEAPIDAIVSVYMLGALGSFQTSTYKVGYDSSFVLAMFLMATFLISVIFMNMLISIMGHTFEHVLEGAEQNGLREQIVLIDDHIWLLDLNEIFKGQKYVLRIAPLSQETENKNDVVERINQTENFFAKTISQMSSGLNRRIANVDINTRFMLEHQFKAIEMMMRKLREQEALKQQQDTKGKEDVQTDFNPELGSLLQSKKKELTRMINLKNVDIDSLSAEGIYEVALDFVAQVDKDKTGKIEFDEFYDLFGNSEDIFLTDEQIRQLFFEIDTSGDGIISMQEFSRAVAILLCPDQE